jgi:hypothetical protein
MRMHLISFGPSIWNITSVGVDFSDKDEELDFEQLQKIHRNAQACTILYPHLKKMSLIESIVLRRPKTFGTCFKELMKAPSS